jgi:hypothetical protein
MLRERARDRSRIRDVLLHERHARILQRTFEAREAAGIGQLVEDEQLIGGMVESLLDEVGADETGSTSDQQCPHVKKKPRSARRRQSNGFLCGLCALGG